MHPIAEDLAHRICASKHLALTPTDALWLEQSLASCDRDELRPAIESVVRVACVIERRGAAQTSNALLDAVSKMMPVLRATGNAREAARVERAERQFRRLTGTIGVIGRAPELPAGRSVQQRQRPPMRVPIRA